MCHTYIIDSILHGNINYKAIKIIHVNINCKTFVTKWVCILKSVSGVILKF